MIGQGRQIQGFGVGSGEFDEPKGRRWEGISHCCKWMDLEEEDGTIVGDQRYLRKVLSRMLPFTTT
jgi:hypothetical protein